MKLTRDEPFSMVCLALAPGILTAIGVPTLLWLKLSQGAGFAACLPALAFYLIGWLLLAVFAVRPKSRLLLWSFVAGILLISSVFMAVRLSARMPAGSDTVKALDGRALRHALCSN